MRRAVGVAVSLVALAWAGSASAQDTPTGNPPAAATTPSDDNAPRVDDIIVTAQKRSENLQDVPVAVSAVTGKTLENKRILDLVDLSNATPGLQIKSDDNGANPRIFIPLSCLRQS